jgi:hypothetical protein
MSFYRLDPPDIDADFPADCGLCGELVSPTDGRIYRNHPCHASCIDDDIDRRHARDAERPTDDTPDDPCPF